VSAALLGLALLNWDCKVELMASQVNVVAGGLEVEEPVPT
jgi:hypothetical protein